MGIKMIPSASHTQRLATLSSFDPVGVSRVSCDSPIPPALDEGGLFCDVTLDSALNAIGPGRGFGVSDIAKT